MNHLDDWFNGTQSSRSQTRLNLGTRANPGQPAFLVLKGWVVGVHDSCLASALVTLKNIIAQHNITAIAWDGDPIQNGSFTLLIPELLKAYPTLSVVIFKKDKSVRKLMSGAHEVDAFGNHMYGYDFISNLTVKSESQLAKEYIITDSLGANRGLVVGFANREMKWYQLGLEGYKYLGYNLAPGAPILIAGLGYGGVVAKENEKIMEEREVYPPAMTQFFVLECARTNPKTNQIESTQNRIIPLV